MKISIYDTVCCEICGSDNGLHIRAVRVNQLGVVTSIIPNETQVYKTKSDARGSIVEIDFWCEFGGHETQARFRFHKGQVIHDMVKLPEIAEVIPSVGDDLGPSELSRD